MATHTFLISLLSLSFLQPWYRQNHYVPRQLFSEYLPEIYETAWVQLRVTQSLPCLRSIITNTYTKCEVDFCVFFSINTHIPWKINDKYADQVEVKLMMYLNPEVFWWLYRTDSRLVPSQWETSLQSNADFQRLGANIESSLLCIVQLPFHVHTNSKWTKYYHTVSKNICWWTGDGWSQNNSIDILTYFNGITSCTCFSITQIISI